MRIGLVIYGSLDTVSGGYLYDRKLVEYLRGQGDAVEIVSLPWRNYGRHLADNLSPDLRNRLANLEVDVLLQDELNHPSLAWVNGRLNGSVPTPRVSIVHHLRASEAHPAAARAFYRQVERRYLDSVDGFIYNSRTTQATVAALSPAPRPAVIAYPAADHLQPPSSAEVGRDVARRMADGGPLQVLFVGNVIGRKGLHTLLHGLAQLPRQAWQLTVAGSLTVDPEYVAAIRRQLQGLGLDRQVTLAGAVPDAELRALYRRCHVLAMPSYEGFGIVYLEAMSCGLPVIASTAGAAHEVVSHGVDGYLAGPDDAAAIAGHLYTWLDDRARLTAMSLNARLRYDRHPTWQESAARIRNWLLELIARR